MPGITKECPKSDVLKEQYFYVFDPALCQKTNQFLAKANPVALPVPEKAIKLPKDQFLPQPVSGSTSDTGANPSEPVHALTVYFDLNSSVIKAGEAKKLHRFIEHVPKTSEIRITGYTCPLELTHTTKNWQWRGHRRWPEFLKSMASMSDRSLAGPGAALSATLIRPKTGVRKCRSTDGQQHKTHERGE
ncbi:MAG: hypothetical protein R2860_07765 [Desulfobacterales bacterium]